VACSSRRQVSGDGRPPAGVLGEAESPGIPRDLGFRAGDSPARRPGHGAVSPGAARRRGQAREPSPHPAGPLVGVAGSPRVTRMRTVVPPQAIQRSSVDSGPTASLGRIGKVRRGPGSPLDRPCANRPAARPPPPRRGGPQQRGHRRTRSPSPGGRPVPIRSLSPGWFRSAAMGLIPLRRPHGTRLRFARPGARERLIAGSGPARTPRPAPGHGDTSSARTTRENNRPT
jgi:hypothetical protein